MPITNYYDMLKTKREFEQEAEQYKLNKQLAQAKLKEAEMGNLGPASVQEWKYFQQMTPHDQAAYLEMKRAPQVLNLGGSQAVRSPFGGIGESYAVTPKPSEMPGFEAEVMAAKKRAEDLQATKSGLGKVEAQSQQMLDLLGQIESHPGLSAVVGMPNPAYGGFGPLGNLPGTPAADFQAKLSQLGGKQFLEAFESLKGGGQITQIEGEKATNAIAAMQTSQSEEQFIKSLNEFKQIVSGALDRARAKASQPIYDYGQNMPPPLPMGDYTNDFGDMSAPPPMPQVSDRASIEESIFNAKKAVRNGADREAVRQRLLEAGINPSLAGL